jgi:hypothetical protein
LNGWGGPHGCSGAGRATTTAGVGNATISIAVSPAGGSYGRRDDQRKANKGATAGGRASNR